MRKCNSICLTSSCNPIPRILYYPTQQCPTLDCYRTVLGTPLCNTIPHPTVLHGSVLCVLHRTILGTPEVS